ncbi:MAG: type IV toxin-antitoxin system AbiEi family antitoxin domain-containing protein [Pseudomonadota bacterium]
MCIMSKLKRTKIKLLLENWPRGSVSTLKYLQTKGYSKDLIHKYVKSMWLEQVGRGAYKLNKDKINWSGGLYALQHHSKLDVHVGAKTVFQLGGHAHYLSQELPEIFLFSSARTKLPQWFRTYKWNVRISFFATNLFSNNYDEGLISFDVSSQYSIRISSQERAAIEMMHLLPKKQSFEEAALLMEGLYYLRADLVQKLLENCNSVKAKRLFMYYAEKYNFDWVKTLDLSKIDFGKGNREIVKGGTLNRKYQITVPKEINEDDEVLF